MDIVVCVKTNPDLQMVRIKNREAVTEAVPYKIGDLEKNALQAAVDLRAAVGGKVVALCLAEGNRKAAEDIKVALAMGADEAVVIDDPALAAPDQAAVAAALAAAVKKLGACDLLLFGEGSTDNYTGQVGPRVAELLGLPQIGYARKVEAAERRRALRAQHGRHARDARGAAAGGRHRGQRDQRADDPRPHADHEGQEQAAAGVVAGGPRASRRPRRCARSSATWRRNRIASTSCSRAPRPSRPTPSSTP